MEGEGERGGQRRHGGWGQWSPPGSSQKGEQEVGNINRKTGGGERERCNFPLPPLWKTSNKILSSF
jgi:hypothetical protein